jgi:phage gp36-like protein
MPFTLTPIAPPVAGGYATQADLQDLFGQDNIATWSQLDNTAVGPDLSRLLKALLFADSVIDDALRGGPCALPLTAAGGSTPALVTHWAATIAGVWLYQSRGGRAGDKEADRYAHMLADIQQQLSQTKAGTLHLDAAPAHPASPACPTVVRDR